MKLRHLLLATASAALLVACGGGSKHAAAPQSKASVAAGKVSSNSPLESAFKFKDGAELDVAALLALLPAGVDVSYEDATFDEKLGATVVSNIKINADVDEDVASLKTSDLDGLRIERAELYGVALDVFEGLGSDQAALDADLKTGFEKIRLFNISGDVHEDGSKAGLKIGGLEFDKLLIREGGLPKDSDADPTAALFNSFSLAGLYFKDIDVAAGEAQVGLALKAPDLRLVGLAGGKIASIIGNDLDYQVKQAPDSIEELGKAMGPAGQLFLNGPLKNFIAPENQRTTLESMEWKAIDFSGLMTYGLEGEKPPLSATDLIDLGTLQALNAKTFINDRMYAFVPETKISKMEFTWLAPSKIRAEAKNAVYDFTAYASPEQEDVLKILNDYGLDNVKADSVMTYDWDAKKGNADFATTYDAEGLADFSMNFALGGLVLEKIDAATAAGDNDAIAGLVEVEGISIELADDHLLDAVFGLAGLQGNMSAEDARKTAVGGLQIARLQAIQLGGRFNDYIDSTSDFLEEGGVLIIKVDPENAVPFSAIAATGEQGPQAIPELLNLTVTHKEKK